MIRTSPGMNPSPRQTIPIKQRKPPASSLPELSHTEKERSTEINSSPSGRRGCCQIIFLLQRRNDSAIQERLRCCRRSDQVLQGCPDHPESQTTLYDLCCSQFVHAPTSAVLNLFILRLVSCHQGHQIILAHFRLRIHELLLRNKTRIPAEFIAAFSGTPAD